MSKRTGNRRGKRGRGKHNKQFSHERGRALAKEMTKRQKEEAYQKPAPPEPPPQVEKPEEPVKDPTEGFF